MKVKYIGPKMSGMYVQLPIGVRSRSAITGNVLLNKEHEFSDGDAMKLVALDPRNFELVKEEPAEVVEDKQHDEKVEEVHKEHHDKVKKHKKSKE